MSGARKKSAIRKAEFSAANERSGRLLAQHHADVMQGFAVAAAQKIADQSALLKTMADALEGIERRIAMGGMAKIGMRDVIGEIVESALTEYRRQQAGEPMTRPADVYEVDKSKWFATEGKP